MAYYITLPDGRNAQFSDDVTPDAARRQIYDAYPEYFPEDQQRFYEQQKAQEGTTALGRGFRSALESTTGNVGALGKYLTGGTFEEMQADLEATEAAAAAENPVPVTFSQVGKAFEKGFWEGLGVLGSYTGEIGGATVPYAGGTVAGGALGTAAAGPPGAVAGAVAGGFPQFFAENVARQVEEGAANEDDINWVGAVASGGAQSALNAAGPVLGGVFGRAAQGAFMRQLLDRAASIPAGRYAAAGVTSSQVEGFTEVAQSALERMQAGLEPFEEGETLENYVGGALLGVIMGPFGAGVSADRSTPAAEAPVEEAAAAPAEVPEQLLLPAPTPAAPAAPPVFDMRPEPDETPTQYAERAVRVAGADFPEGPYRAEFKDTGYQVLSADDAPVGLPFATADQAQEVINTYNDRQQEIDTERGAREALRRTKQVETEALLTAARESVTPSGEFTIKELGPKLTGRVNNWRVTRGLASLDTFTLEDLADARVPRAEIDKLLEPRKPVTTAEAVTPDMVRATAEDRNITADDENFRVFARRTTGAEQLDRMSQTQLQVLNAKLTELPANDARVTLPVVAREQFTSEQYRSAVDALQQQGRYSVPALKNATGLTQGDDLRALRDAMVRRGDLVKRSNNDFRLADVLPVERKTTPKDLPEGATRAHVIKEMPIEKVRVRQNGKSIGSFADGEDARSKVAAIRESEAQTGATPSEINIEPVEETGFGVFENRYDADGTRIGEVLVDSKRSRKEAEQEARVRDGLPAEEPPPRKPPPPEAIRGRMTAVVDALEGFAKNRKLQNLGTQVRLVEQIKTPGGENVRGVTVPTESGGTLIALALDHLTPDMSTDEVINSLAGWMDHETVHALRRAGVLAAGSKEWKALDRYARKARDGDSGETFYQYADRVYRGRPGYMTEDSVVEEAIAEAFRSWANDRRSVRPPASGIFQKIAQWFKNLVTRMPSDIFRAIETGTLPEMEADAVRTRAAVSAGPNVPPRYAISAPLGARVPPVTSSRQFDITRQRTEGAVGQFLHDLGRSKKNLPLVNASIFDIRVKTQDKMLSVKEMLEVIKDTGGQVTDFTDPYLLETLYHGRTVERIRQRERQLYVPLMQAIQTNSKVDLKDVEDYLYARHAPERNAELRAAGSTAPDPSGMSDIEAVEIMNGFTTDGKLPALERIAALADEIVRDTTRTRVAAGLISEEQAASSPYQNYMPLRGFAQEDLDPELPFEENMRARSGRGFSVAGREDLAPTGRTRKAGDILGHLFLQNEEAVIRGEKNRVAQSFLALVEANPHSGFARVLDRVPTRPTKGADGRIRKTVDMNYRQAPHIIIAKVDGKEVVLETQDPRVARALKMDYPSTSGAFVNVLGKLNRYLATINTAWSPEFLISNFFRDLQTAGILAQQYDVPKLATNTIRSVPAALKGIRAVLRNGDTSSRWSKAFMELQDDGGTTEFLGIRDLETQIAKIRSEVGSMDKPRFAGARKFIGSIGKFAEDYNKIVENGARLAAYVNAREAGVSRPQAAYLAKNLTVNFNKGGEWKSMMNSLYLFYNASLQGTMVMMNGLRSKRVQKIVGGIVVGGALQDMTNRMLSGDNDDNGILDYDEIPDYVLEHNLVFMDPLGIAGDNKYIAIPMPYGFNAFYNAGRGMSAVLNGSKRWTPGKTASSIAASFVDSFNPLGGAESFLNFVSPTVLDPIVDLYENRDFADRAIVPERPGFGVPTPQSQLYWNSTAEPFKWVSEQLNDLTGGNPVRSGAIDISPEVLEHAYDYVLGSLGAFIMRTQNAAVMGLGGDLNDIEIGQIPFLRRMVGSITERQNRETYYLNSAEILTLDKELEFYKETRNFTKAREILRTQRRQASMIPMFKRADRELQKLRKKLKTVRDSDQMAESTRERLEDQYRAQMDRVMRSINRLYLR